MPRTFGEGDPSDNATAFRTWLRQQKNGSLLSQLRYAFFGLGNSNCRYFNRVADTVDAALAATGARRSMPIARADDANGSTGEDFLAWKQSWLFHLQHSLGYSERAGTFEPLFQIEEEPSLAPQDLCRAVPRP